MTILEAYQYTQDRLNKLSTNSGQNVAKHVFVRAFNATQDMWVEDRVKLSETNTLRDDEIQILSVPEKLFAVKKEGFWQTKLPENYYHFKRAVAYTPCEVFLYRKFESNVNRLLSDENWQPSLEWGESFCTVMNNTLRVYGDFNVDYIDFIYYRKPINVNMADGFDDNLGNPNVDIDPEFDNSSLFEILNQTALLLSADSGDSLRFQTLSNQTTQHT